MDEEGWGELLTPAKHCYGLGVAVYWRCGFVASHFGRSQEFILEVTLADGASFLYGLYYVPIRGCTI